MRSALAAARREKGLIVQEMADLLGISASFYYKIESGARNPTMKTAKEIADLLGRGVDELFFAQHLDVPSKSAPARA